MQAPTRTLRRLSVSQSGGMQPGSAVPLSVQSRTSKATGLSRMSTKSQAVVPLLYIASVSDAIMESISISILILIYNRYIVSILKSIYAIIINNI